MLDKNRLSVRLQTLASFVTKGNRLADIGTDHGYIPIYLVSRGVIPSAIAMDIGEGPLSRAKEHIALYGLSDKIETRLSDGLQKLERNEADTVLIAGMGGPLMQRILKDGMSVLRSVPEMILQPQSDIADFRAFLIENGFVIRRERFVIEEGKYYPMMLAGWADEKETEELKAHPYQAHELLYGRASLQEDEEVLKEFLEHEMAVCDQIFASLSRADTGEERIKERLTQVEEKKMLIREREHDSSGNH